MGNVEVMQRLDRFRYNFAINNPIDSTTEFSSDLVMDVAGGRGESNIIIREFDFTCHLVDITGSQYISLFGNHLRLDLIDRAGQTIRINDGEPTTGNGQIINNTGAMSSSAPLIFKQEVAYKNIDRIVNGVARMRFQWRPLRPVNYAFPVSWQFTGYASIVFDKIS